MNYKSLIAAAMLCAVLPAYGNAMTFRAEIHAPNGRLMLHFDGKIEHGDAARAIEFYQQTMPQYPGKEPVVYLNSEGGYVVDGVKLANFIREKKLEVMVSADAQCNSACFMLFTAGTKRYVGKGAHVGVHSVYDSEKKEEDVEAQAVTVRMSRALLEHGAPPHIIGKLIGTNFKDIYRLTDDDFRSMQVTICTGPCDTKPVVVAAPVIAPMVVPGKPVAPAKPMATVTLSPTKPMAPVSAKPVTSGPATATVRTPTPTTTIHTQVVAKPGVVRRFISWLW